MEQLSDKILAASDGGRGIITMLYPDAEQCFEQRKKFRLRESDKTPSTSIKNYNGVWKVKDFGSGESMDAIALFAYVKNIEWTNALKELAALYQIEGTAAPAKFEFEKRKAKKGEKDGEVYFKYHDKLLPDHLKVFGPITTQKAAEICNLKAAVSYTRIKNGEALTFKSTKDYPILVYDFGTWQKIYQPKSYNKAFRFSYAGKKSEGFVFGFENVEALRLQKIEEAEQAFRDDAKNDEKQFTDEMRNAVKLDKIVIASGDSDGINFLSLGIPTVWQLSETTTNAQFSKLFNQLKGFAYKVVYAPDLDATGIKEARKKALFNLQLHTMYLPSWVKEYKDFRGNAGKDFKDYVISYSKKYASSLGLVGSTSKKEKLTEALQNNVKLLLNNAIKCQFWKNEYTSKGKFKGYKFDRESCLYFLQCNGFFIKVDGNDKYFVKQTNNVLQQVTDDDIRYFIAEYLRKGLFNQELRNFILEGNKLSKDNVFKDLPQNEIEVKTGGKNHQMLHFKNISWRITADNVEEIKPINCSELTWEDFIKPHTVQRQENEVVWEYDNDLKMPFIKQFPDKPKCKFLEFISLSSNMHWQKEKQINKLKHDDQLEVFHHILNKMYAIGYLCHDFKQESLPIAIWIMENDIITNGESQGGTGKSILAHGIKHVQPAKFINGRDKENKWPYSGTTKSHRIYWFDDVHQRYDMHKVFTNISGDLEVNHKGGAIDYLDFKDSGKHLFTSNYSPKDKDGSSARRLLYVLMSDFFHSPNDEKGYRKTFSPNDYFGSDLFVDFSAQDWTNFYNTIAMCIQFYMQIGGDKVEPPMQNAEKRELIEKMGVNFYDWAEDYFGDPAYESKMFNTYLDENEVYNSYPKPRQSKNRFTRSLKAYCKFKGYEFNPTDVKYYQPTNKKIRKDNQSKIYIRTKTVSNLPF